MPNFAQCYAMKDDPTEDHKAIRIRMEDAWLWNQGGYGIFQTINHFRGRRQIKNLISINAWAVDIDEGSKAEMIDRIRRGLVPTMIVETKRGYQVYWKAKDGTLENWNQIVACRLVPFYGADKRARDAARILRVPGFHHRKVQSDPFYVRKIHEEHVEYSEREMFQFYRDQVTAEKNKRDLARIRKQNSLYGGFWDRVWNLNCEYALSQLSGTKHVGFETYEFKQNASGTKNIWVNGKSSSCWIDTDGRIGSLDSGGPTIAQWLNWFHKDYKITIHILNAEFPELHEPVAGEQMGFL